MLTTTARAIIASALTTAAVLTAPVTASHASTNEAVSACGASVIDSESAYVPAGVRSEQFISFATTRGTIRVNCGNGTSWGAVHIELKHEVPSWAEASACIAKTISRGSPRDGEGTKIEYHATINGVAMVAVRGNNGLLTAYPRGTTGIAAKWSTCAG